MKQRLPDATPRVLQKKSKGIYGSASNLKQITKAGFLFLFLLFSYFHSYGQLATETFDSSIPSTWTVNSTSNGLIDWEHTTDGYTTGAAVINPATDNIGQNNTASYYLITPQVSAPANGQLRFFSKLSATANPNTVFEVRISTASQPDISGFNVPIATLTDIAVGNYQEIVVDLPAGTNPGDQFYLAFVATNTQTGVFPSGTSWFVDNVRVVEACTLIVEDVTIENITTSEATISWITTGAESYEVQVIKADESLGDSGFVTLADTYIATELEGGTQYHVYIRSYCADDIGSEWAGPFNFTTTSLGHSCDEPIAITGDYYFLFANLADYNGNHGGFTNHGANCLPAAVQDNYLNGSKIYFSYTAPEDGVINISQMTHPWMSGTQCWGNSQSAVLVYEGCADVGVECIAGLYTNNTNTPQTIDNLPVVGGQVYTIVISTLHASGDASVCFDFELSFTTCPAPSIITYNNLLQESVEFSWDNPENLGDSWEYLVLPEGSPAPTGSGTATSTNQNNLIDGLTPGESYDFYVRSICGTTPGNWSAPFNFTTQCGVHSLPYYTSFEIGGDWDNTDGEPCWTVLDYNNDGVKWDFLGNWEPVPPAYATIVTETNQNNNNDYLVSPQIHIPAGSNVKLRYKHNLTGWNPTNYVSYSVRLSTTGIGADNFTHVINANIEVTSESWQEVTYDIPSNISGDVHIAWIIEPVTSGTTHNSFRLNIGDVNIYEDCDAPSNLGAQDATETSAVLTWTPANSSDTQWEVLVVDFQTYGSDMPTLQESGVLVNTDEYTYGDLTPGWQYEFYVRTACSATAKSDWIGPFYFTTLCGVVSEPYFETFNADHLQINDPLTKRFCWEILDQNTDNQTWNFSATAATINVQSTGNDDWLISPAIALDDSTGGFHELSFNHRKQGGASESYAFEVLISNTDTNPSSFTELISYQDYGSNTSYQNKIHYFEATGTVYIAFRVPTQFMPTQNFSVQIDNFSVKVADPCPMPTNIVRDAATNTFTWNAGNNETQWEVTILTSDEFIPTQGIIVDSPSYVATDLEPGTTYKFFVKAICDVNNISNWEGPLQFTIPCDQIFTTPFIETFELNSPSLNCWTPNAWHTDNALFPYEGNYSANVYTWDGNNTTWLISPTVTITEGQRLRFYYRASQYAPDYTEDLKVWLSISGNEIADFTTLLFEINQFVNTEYKEVIINLPEGISGNINIAFQVPPRNPADFRQNLFIDNVIIEDTPVCPAPYNIDIVSLTDTSFLLGWESSGTETEWEALVLPYTTANPFENIDPNNIQILTSNPGTITGLLPATAYDVYIRPVCSETSSGEWSELIPVVTLCNFENLCEYTITLHSGANNTLGIAGGINVIQNGYIVQTLEFPGNAPWYQIMEPIDYIVYLCDGVEFTLHWDSFGWAPNQYPEAYVKVTNSAGEEIWMSDLGIGLPKSDIFTGIVSCNAITCPQPTDLTVSETGVFSWTAGGTETQWEVYIQPHGLGMLPQSGTLVSTTSYTPAESDFIHADLSAYEYFVRAICGEDNTSYWSGPFAYVRNDDASNAVVAPVNQDGECITSLDNLTFLGSTPSSDSMSCDIPHNGGDIWIEFEATSLTHHIELGNFSGGPHNDAGQPQLPRIVMTLYKVNTDDSLEEMACSYNNVLRTMYSVETEIGKKYMIRLTNTNDQPNQYTFSMCITTLTDLCKINAPNFSFESPGMASSHTIETIYFDNVVPGWNSDTPGWGHIYFWGSENIFFPAYHGGQFIQLLVEYDEETGEPPLHDPSDLTNVFGEYQDFDTSEITQMDYSFAHRRRPSPMFDDPSITRVVQLFAGPVGGPYTLVKEEVSTDAQWKVAAGKYNVPQGQDKTRFIFRTKNNVGMIVIDAANFVPFNGVITTNHTIDCEDPQTELRAEGVGEWIADDNNPAPVIFSDATNKATTVSGFTAPGEYTFHWKTRYCQDSVTITFEGIDEVPTVNSPIEYCQDEAAEPLTASELAGYDLLFYTEEVGGTGVASITPDTSVTGTTTYYVAYVDEFGCEGARVAIEVIVNELITPVVEFSYDEIEYCTGSANPVISLATDFTTGGTFTATPTGLAIDATTGAIDLAGSDIGIYSITYTIEENGCVQAADYTVDIAIVDTITSVVEFSYENSVCISDLNPIPTVGGDFTWGGTFSSVAGLTIDADTGEIDLATSNAGTYTITYTVETDGCHIGGTHDAVIVINALINPVTTFSYEEVCITETAVLPVLAQDFTLGGEFSAIGIYVDPITGEIDVTNTEAGTYTVTYEIEADEDLCMAYGSYSFEVTITSCMVPKGISPNGDGLNDWFDLTGLNVRQLNIYNRYGREVYSQSNYVKEWGGQDNDGNELPDGTYYYAIEKRDGEQLTGWIYINRNY